MKIGTIIIHDDEDYLPEGLEGVALTRRPSVVGDRGYGYNADAGGLREDGTVPETYTLAERKEQGLDDEPDEPYVFVEIEGKTEALERFFEVYASRLDGGPRGGDDDAFDYYPSNFDALVDFAVQLDEVSGGGAHFERAQAIWDSMFMAERIANPSMSETELLGYIEDEVGPRPER